MNEKLIRFIYKRGYRFNVVEEPIYIGDGFITVGKIYYPHEGSQIICLNDDYLLETMTHEIGHLICDHILGYDYHMMNTQKRELLADFFIKK